MPGTIIIYPKTESQTSAVYQLTTLSEMAGLRLGCLAQEGVNLESN